MHFFQTILQATLVNPAKKQATIIQVFLHINNDYEEYYKYGFFLETLPTRVPMLMTSNSIIHCVHVHKGRNKEAANLILGNLV